MRTVLLGILTASAVTLGSVRPGLADQLCDPASQDCRAILLDLDPHETVGIDVAFWFMEDARYSASWCAVSGRRAGTRPGGHERERRASRQRPDHRASSGRAGIPIRRRMPASSCTGR